MGLAPGQAHSDLEGNYVNVLVVPTGDWNSESRAFLPPVAGFVAAFQTVLQLDLTVGWGPSTPTINQRAAGQDADRIIALFNRSCPYV